MVTLSQVIHNYYAKTLYFLRENSYNEIDKQHIITP